MCMVHATPHRAYRIIILKHKLHRLDTHQGNQLLNAFRKEVAEGAYTDAAIWHPIATELLTFAAQHMEEIQDLVGISKDWKYPVCDVIEGIADLLDFLGEGGFTATSQQAHLESLATADITHRWIYDVSKLLQWINRFSMELPLATELLKRLDIAGKIRRLQEQRAAEQAARAAARQHSIDMVNTRLNPVRQRVTTLKSQLQNWKFQGTTRIEGLSLGTVQHLLGQGYTLSQCRQIIRGDQLPRVSWYEAGAVWKTELAALPVDDWNRLHLDKLQRKYNSVGKRTKAIARHVVAILSRMETGLPLIRHVWPELAVTIDTTGETWQTLAQSARLGETLQSRLNYYSAGRNEPEALAILLQEADQFLASTAENDPPPLSLAA